MNRAAGGERLQRLLNPTSLAFVGGAAAETSLEQCEQLGFDGDLWLVNPAGSAVRGRPSFATISDLPRAPDAALVAVNRHLTLDVVHQLATAGAGAAICYASGFAEVGEEGAALQAQLLDAAGAMPLLGPNCYGTLSGISGAALWPDQQGMVRVETGVAFVTQSGNIAVNLTMQQRGLDVAHVLTLGNQIDVCVEECLEALVRDPRVTAVGLHIEALSDVGRFASAMQRAHDRRLPVVALKTGSSERGASIAASHTSSIVGDDAAYGALFDRLGVRRVRSIPELLDTLKMLTHHGPIAGNRLVSLSCSGGEASLVADRSEHFDVVFPSFEPDHRARINETLGDLVNVSNPLDYHTFIWGDIDRLEACFAATLDGPVDAALLVLDFPKPGLSAESWWPTLEAFASACVRTQIAGVVASSMAENLPGEVRSRAEVLGLVAFGDIDQALRSVEAASWLGRWRPSAAPMELGESLRESVLIDLEVAAKHDLAMAGLPVVGGVVLPGAGGALDVGSLEFPLVVKATGLAHKSDVGGVILGIDNDADLADALDRALAVSPRVLVEQYVSDSVAELLITVRVCEPVGYLLTLGSGGTLVELLADTRSALLPVSSEDVVRLLGQLVIWPILSGHRGAAGGDVGAVVDLVEKLTEFVAHRTDVLEVELNPVLICASGAVIVDALITRGDEHG